MDTMRFCVFFLGICIYGLSAFCYPQEETKIIPRLYPSEELEGLMKNPYIGLPISEDKIRKLIKKFGPIVYFHPKEKYFPESVKDYVNKSKVICCENIRLKKLNCPNTVENPTFENPTLDTLAELAKTRKDRGGNCLVVLKDKKLGYRGSTPDRDGRITAPAYVSVYQVKPDYYILQFAYFYSYNGPTIKLGKIKIGTHEGDWEHMDVHVVKGKSGSFHLKRVHYAAHQQFKGDMYEMHQFPMSGTHPIAYAALYGHASLPIETSRKFLKMDANLDVTKKSKYIWDCSKHYQLVAINGNPVPGKEWIEFDGPYGETQEGRNNLFANSPKGLSDARWLRRENRDLYNLVDDNRNDKEAGKGLLIRNDQEKGQEGKKGKGTRSFVYESPSRLSSNFCLSFFSETENKYVNDRDLPPFKIVQKQYGGLKKKTLFRSGDAFPLTKKDVTYKYCFVRPQKTHLEKMKFIWATDEVPTQQYRVRLLGFEFLGEENEKA